MFDSAIKNIKKDVKEIIEPYHKDVIKLQSTLEQTNKLLARLVELGETYLAKQ